MSDRSRPIVTWDPAAYAANSSVQHGWARELISRLNLRGCERILDVGCGDGKVTAELARAVPHGAVTGVDCSTEMIRFAHGRFRPGTHPNLNFAVKDARQLRFRKKFDLVFSNAALHWVDDHPAFLRGAAASLRTGGRLVVSCGGKGNAQDVFAALRAQMRRTRWRTFFRKLAAPYFFHRPEEYERWLPRFGFQACGVRLVEKDTAYTVDGLKTWLVTTWLPYTQRVPAIFRDEFIAGVVSGYLAKHPVDGTGQVRVRMVRLEMEALKLAAT